MQPLEALDELKRGRRAQSEATSSIEGGDFARRVDARSPSAGSSSTCAAAPGATTASTCRSTATTRRRTPRSRSPRSSRSSATAPQPLGRMSWSRASRSDLAGAPAARSASSRPILVDAAHNPHGASRPARRARPSTSTSTSGRRARRAGRQGRRTGIVAELRADRRALPRHAVDVRAGDRRRRARRRSCCTSRTRTRVIVRRPLEHALAAGARAGRRRRPKRGVVVTGSITLVGDAIQLAEREGWK